VLAPVASHMSDHKQLATRPPRQCPTGWWALSMFLGVHSPLSIAVMVPVSPLGLSRPIELRRGSGGRLMATVVHVGQHAPTSWITAASFGKMPTILGGA